MIRWMSLLFVLAVALTGCSNDCDRYCSELAKYWDECDISYEQSEVADCKKAWRRNADPISGVDQNAHERYGTSICRTMTSLEENDEGERMIALRARFTCEDMRAGPGGSFGGSR